MSSDSPPTPVNPDYPRLSVLVMSHNQENFIRETIDSVLNQRYEAPLEIVFCDDCSTDGTYYIIQQELAHYTGPFHIIAHRCPQNGHVATNMNVAISLSSGDWLLRVDGDDIQHPDRCALTAEAIRKHPNATVVTGQLQAFQNGSAVNPVSTPPYEQLHYKSISLRDFKPGAPPPVFEWWGGTMALSRRIFDVFGPLPPECDVLDDTMFATRTLMLGEFVTIQNGTLVYYRRHAGNISSERDHATSLRSILRSERAATNYYRRGLPCHDPILRELMAFTAEHPEAEGLAAYFNDHLTGLRKAACLWDTTCIERCLSAWGKHPEWPLRARLSHTFSVISPFCHALHTWLHSK